MGLPFLGQVSQAQGKLAQFFPALHGPLSGETGEGAVQMEVGPVYDIQHSYYSSMSVRLTETHFFFSVSMVKRQALSLQLPSASSYRRGSPPKNRLMEWSGLIPRTERFGPVIPRSVTKPVPLGRTTEVCVNLSTTNFAK